MPMCTTGRGGVIGLHAHGNVVRQVADDHDNTRRGGTIGPHTQGNAVRHVVDDLNAEWSGQHVPQNKCCRFVTATEKSQINAVPTPTVA